MKPYMTFNGRIVMEVRCKGDCSTVLVQRRGVAQNLRLDKSNDYGELVIELRHPNGLVSKVETAMCRACRERLRNNGARPGEIEAIYAQDLYQMVEEAVVCGTPRETAEQMIAFLRDSIPVRVLPERGRGETYI